MRHADGVRARGDAGLPLHDLDRLYRGALALTGDRRDAAELVHDTCVDLSIRRRRTRRDATVGHLLQSLRRQHVENRRRAARRPTSVALEGTDAARPSADPHERAGQREPLSLVSGLRDEWRDALVAVDVMRLSHQETAHALGLPLETVMTRLYRARYELAQLLAAQAVSA